jgi:signal transduction histidine kinase
MKRSGKNDKSERLSLIRMGALFVVAVLWFLPAVVNAQQNHVTKRVLVLYWDNKDVPANLSFDQTFQAGLRAYPGGNVEYYAEYFDSSRFPGERQNELLRDYLRDKYAGMNIDVVVTSVDPPLEFMRKYRAELFPNSPLVFVAVKHPSKEEIQNGPGMTGIIRVSTHKQTMDLALWFHPDTKQVFVISGTPEHDRRFETVARQELSEYENRVGITYLTDLSIAELVDRTKSLPQHSVILYLWQRSFNEHNTPLQTYEVLASFAPTASAPIYSMGSRNVGYGIVGGYVQDSEQNGVQAAAIVRQILSGTRAQDIPIVNAPSVPMFNWKQLKRWGISESSLPSGSIVNFKEFTFWEQYKWRIIAVVTIFLLQTMLIAVLLLERRRRQRAKESLDLLNAELEERIAIRTAALAAKSRELETFAYSVAHDLKAPLRGIDGYSRLLLEDYSDKLDQDGRDFVQTIHRSTSEMAQLIEDLLDYSRLERREFKPHEIPLGPLVNSVIEQKQREMNGRSIDFVINVNGGAVYGDANGLTQALKNYVDNAVKFTRDVPAARIEVGSQEQTDSYLLWVQDNGVGFDMKYHDRIFEIFQRLNRSEDYEGTGIGLAIVRKAMERMGGRAWGEGLIGKGATFYLEIPKTLRGCNDADELIETDSCG